MADDSATNAEAGAEATELRPCSYCGTDIHPSSPRCIACGGHVGISWGTVHKELFLFLLASILIAVGCVSSWAIRTPTGDGDPSNGLRTIRGCLMFALALYGVTSAYFSIFSRKMVIWPFLLNALMALWVGIPVLSNSIGGPAWTAWGKSAESGGTLMDKALGGMRAIPPGLMLVTLGGLLVAISVLKGLVAGFIAGKAKKKAAQEEAEMRNAARRRVPRAGEATPAADGTPPGVAVGDAAGGTVGGPAGDPGHDTAG